VDIVTLDAPKVTTEKDAADIRAILDALAAAYRAKDAKAIERHYMDGARIADLAPPLLRRGFDALAVQSWHNGWDGEVEIVTRAICVEIDDALAVATACSTSARGPGAARTRPGGRGSPARSPARRRAGGSPTSTSRCRSTWTAASGRPWTFSPERGGADAR
jgi:ketosteroid isomerase-like protein